MLLKNIMIINASTFHNVNSPEIRNNNLNKKLVKKMQLSKNIILIIMIK
jgi:hypothetical protein